MTLLIRWILNAAALIGIAYLINGIDVSGFYIALIVALLLGLVNAVLRPILFFLTLPINILTLGLFSLLINAFLFWFVSTFVQGFEVTWFWPAFLGALLFSFITSIVNKFVKAISD